MLVSSSRRSRGMIIEICWPMASFAVYPNSRSAPAFQLVMTPSKVLLTIASSEESTIEASKPIALSAFRRNAGSSSKID